MRAPATLAAVPLLAGTAAGILLVDSTPSDFVFASAIATWLALIAGCGFLADRFDPAVVLCVVLGSAAAGFSIGTSCTRAVYGPPLMAWFDANTGDAGDPVAITGRLREDAAATDYGALLVLDVTHVGATPASGGVRLSVGGAVPAAAVVAWRAGRTVRMPVLLRHPSTFRNPGIRDDTRALARRGIALTGTVKSAALVEVLAPGHRLAELAGAARQKTRDVLSRHLRPLDARSAAIAIAILIGDRSGLPAEDERRLQQAGTYHVIAISGGNIAILTVLLMFGARAMRVPYRAASLGAIVVLLFYGEVAGGAASVSRAVSAAVIFLSALALDHRGSPLNTVAMAAVLGVAVSPLAVLDAGFLLSFGATTGIIVGVPRLLPAVRGAKGWLPLRAGRALALAVSAMLAATICAEIALAPMAATFFSRITLAGLVVNFAAIPLMTAVQAGSMALLAAAEVSSAWADRIAVLVHAAATGLVESSRFIDVAPWLAREVSAPAWWLCALYYGACVGLLVRRARNVSAFVFAAAAICLVAAPSHTSRGLVARTEPGVLRVVVLDVGQGDATVALLPNGSALVIDSGGLAGTSFDVGRRVLIPALRALQVERLHALVLTHADPDHVGGADAVIHQFRPPAVWEGVPVPPHPVLRALTARARTEGIAWRTVRPGDVERAGGVEIRVLHPPEPEWERQRVRNDDSVVLELRYGGVSILLPGDIGREVERSLLPSLHDLARLVVLKAAHHGSATSSSDEFLDATKPRAVIFSAGRNNMFGHPARVVVERFSQRGIPMFNTAHDGAVFIDTDGRSVRVWGWASRSVSDIH